MSEQVRCLQCGLVQPNPTPRSHSSVFTWTVYNLTVCVRCGHEYAAVVIPERKPKKEVP